MGYIFFVMVMLTWLVCVCVCVRGVGCIFFEMASGRPLFAGSAVDEQLHLIVKLLGTPNELTWPGVSQLHEFLAYDFPRYRPEPLVKHVPRSVIRRKSSFEPICLLAFGRNGKSHIHTRHNAKQKVTETLHFWLLVRFQTVQ